jgi:hypothetical protein
VPPLELLTDEQRSRFEQATPAQALPASAAPRSSIARVVF